MDSSEPTTDLTVDLSTIAPETLLYLLRDGVRDNRIGLMLVLQGVNYVVCNHDLTFDIPASMALRGNSSPGESYGPNRQPIMPVHILFQDIGKVAVHVDETSGSQQSLGTMMAIQYITAIKHADDRMKGAEDRQAERYRSLRKALADSLLTLMFGEGDSHKESEQSSARRAVIVSQLNTLLYDVTGGQFVFISLYYAMQEERRWQSRVAGRSSHGSKTR